MKRTHIEWVVEELDGEDIVDIYLAASYAEVCNWVVGESSVFRFGLVRDYYPSNSPTMERAYAYIVDGLLAAEFTDEFGDSVALVPKRYFKEMENSV